MSAQPEIEQGGSHASTDARIWHPWLRVERLIRAIRQTTWDSDQWPVAKLVLRRTLSERRKLAQAGWFNSSARPP